MKKKFKMEEENIKSKEKKLNKKWVIRIGIVLTFLATIVILNVLADTQIKQLQEDREYYITKYNGLLNAPACNTTEYDNTIQLLTAKLNNKTEPVVLDNCETEVVEVLDCNSTNKFISREQFTKYQIRLKSCERKMKGFNCTTEINNLETDLSRCRVSLNETNTTLQKIYNLSS